VPSLCAKSVCQACVPSLCATFYLKGVYKMREVYFKDLVPGETYYIEKPNISETSRPMWEQAETYSNEEDKKTFIDSASEEKILKYGFIEDYKYQSGKKIGVFAKYIIKNGTLYAKFINLRDLPGAKLKASGLGSYTINYFYSTDKYYKPESKEIENSALLRGVLRSITGDPHFDNSTKGGKSKKSRTKKNNTTKRRNKMRGKKTK